MLHGLLVLAASLGFAAPPARPEAQARAFLARHCLACHGPNKPKGDFRVDRLAADLGDRANRQRWQAVLKRVQAGEMPPKPQPRPSAPEVQALANWVRTTDAAAGRVVLRRLNRVEYENTMRDLLGIHAELKDL